MRNFSYVVLSTIVILSTCAPKSVPYDNGPVMSQRNIEKTFQPILQFMNYKPGMSFADVGAGSGALTIMMASLMDNSEVYIQDIDTSVLKEGNLNRIIDHYSKQSGMDLREKNNFTLTIGDIEHTNLPDNRFDLIYSNATVHNFTSLDSMVTDLGRKLKPSLMQHLSCNQRTLNIGGQQTNDFLFSKKLVFLFFKF